MSDADFHRPVWDRGEPIDAQMLAFTVGDDPQWDVRLVEHDILLDTAARARRVSRFVLALAAGRADGHARRRA